VISRRQRNGWKEPRPYFDRKNQEITRVLRAHQRIDMIIRDGKIEVRGMVSFSLVELSEQAYQGEHLKRLRCFSIPSGAGVAKAALVETGLYECVGGVDFWNAAVDTFKLNFSNSLTLFGDIRHVSPSWVPQTDVAWLSCECTDFSLLGLSGMDTVGGLAPHYARLVFASGARAVIIEQIPRFYVSRSYRQLRELLAAGGFTNFYESVIEAHAFGSVPSRNRGYAVAFKDNVGFNWPETPRIPARFRQTVGQVIGSNWESKGEFLPIARSYIEQLQNRSGERNNFTVEHNRTLVGLEDTRMAAILASYSRTNSTSSYLLHPDGKHWRKFLSSELSRFMHIPSWFVFPEWMSENQRTQLIGQSVDASVVKAIGVEVAVSLMKAELGAKRPNVTQALIQNKTGQFEFMM
jgi:DNA (cytosine-5)-methyltransferase 1